MITLNAIIVDDSDVNLMLFKHLVAKLDGIEARCFTSSAEALDWCEYTAIDLAIVDYMMPEPDGIEFVRRLRTIPCLDDIPAVIVTANDHKEVRYAALDAGATDFLTKPVDKHEFLARIGNLARLRRAQKLLSDRTALLAEEVAAATARIVERERETIFRLSRAAEIRDPETGSHILRMAHYSRLIAGQLDLPEDERQMIFEAAPMHDIGKVGTPDVILLKPGRLTPEEFEVMKHHATMGHDILKDSSSPILRLAATIALAHHEKYDGSGYPRGIAGAAIPLPGRIVALADVFDALTSERTYKKNWSPEQALAFIREQSGRHFDPVVVDAFVAVWDEAMAIRERYRDREPPPPDSPEAFLATHS